MMKVGISLRRSAKVAGVSEQHLRRYIKENAGARRIGSRWIFDDQRSRAFPVYSQGALKTLTLDPYEARSASLYMHATRQFLWSGNIDLLSPYIGAGVTDTAGRFHPFEVDPNRLYELDARGELNFPELYRIINPGAGDHV